MSRPDAKQMLIWGPLKDTGVRRDWVCAGKRKSNSLFIASSCFVLQTSSRHPLKLAPLSFSSVSAPPPPASHFLQQRHAWGHSLNRNRFVQFAVVFFHGTSLSLSLSFLSCLKAEQRGYSEERNVLTLLFMCCYTLFCISRAFIQPVPFSLVSGKLSI